MVIRAAREVSQLTTPAEVQRALQSREEVTTTLICKPSGPAACFICTGEGLAAEAAEGPIRVHPDWCSERGSTQGCY